MCFSAEVSFTASAVLTVSGIVAVKKATSPKQIWFACIPFIFAIQQLAEGVLWYSYSHDGFADFRTLSTATFLIFAQVIWPFWVPFSVLMVEENPKRRLILKYFLLVGVTLSVYVSYCLFVYPFNAYPDAHHLKYELGFPLAHSLIAALFYFVPTVLSCVVSTKKRMTTLGLVIFSSYIIARIFFSEYSLSMWCFFSAIISVLVIYVVHLMRPVSTGHTGRSIHAMEG
ncbi:MAG: hypothetical protein M3R17_05960 [Bacteroidota bacterium]|nr:hypothetical protein [Bacteroidota bacterium]